MTLIALRGAVKSFGARRVLDGLNLEVSDNARMGLVGPNGSGKSTLLRILDGLEHPDSAPAVRRRELTTAFLPQLVTADPRSPQAILAAARPQLAEVEHELEEVAAQLADPEVHADLDRMGRVLRRQERLLARFEELDGHAFEGRSQAMLETLGLTTTELDRPAAELS